MSTLHAATDLTQSEEYTMPCAEALMAGTLALMTGHGQACCDDHRALMANKIVENLFALAQHPLLSPPFKTMLWNLRTRWEVRIEAAADQRNAEHAAAHRALTPQELDPRLWHAGPASVQ